jgi:hypothetical protein
VVHHAVEAVTRPQRRNPRTALALICCLALLGGCGGSSGSSDKSTSSNSKKLPVELRAPPVGSVRTADCRDWKRGTVAQRRSTVVALRKFAGGPVGSSAARQTGPVLDDPRAYKVLKSYCANYFARGFKLYKLYERAAAFVGH